MRPARPASRGGGRCPLRTIPRRRPPTTLGRRRRSADRCHRIPCHPRRRARGGRNRRGAPRSESEGPGPAGRAMGRPHGTVACTRAPHGRVKRRPPTARWPHQRARRSSRTDGIRRRRTGSSLGPTIAPGTPRRILARLGNSRARRERGPMDRGRDDDERRLGALARSWGVQTSYTSVSGTRVWASREALLATLSALGAPARDGGDLSDAIRERRRWYWERPLEPVVVAWDGRLSDVSLRVPAGLGGDRVDCGVELEGTDEVIARRVRVRHAGTAEVDANRFVDLRFGLKERLPFGYHTLRVRFGRVEAEATVISAPPRGTRPGRAKAWGALLPLYALRTERNLGVGDLTDLAQLAGWIAGLGGGVLATLPLLAAFDGRLFEASPYSPASRLFWNELYVDVTRVPELDHCGEARDLLGSNETLFEARRLRSARLVDFQRAMALKRPILEALARSFFERPSSPSRRRAHHEFLSVNPGVEDYAAFRAVCDRRGQPWQRWPEPARSGILRPNGADASTRLYHSYAQWLAWEQMNDAAAGARAKGTSLYLDLPLGVNPAGYDVWRERGLFALDAGAGAPP